MHLINVHTLRLEEFLDAAKTPKYAILSHTWGEEEVLFKDMQHPDASLMRAKKGFAKVTGTCKEARRHGYDYVWIDSCCIDKSSSAELSEAINSMFLWYQEAQECYAYIQDMPADVVFEEHDSVVYYLKESRWFTRGWTLQELLAPSRLNFYNSAWGRVGSKARLAEDITTFTNINIEALLGKSPLSSFSVAQRMSWAAGRVTTRVEDRAYSLFGIFDVNLPPLYGERAKAFQRLQEEIISHSPDMTILCWDSMFDARHPDRSPRPHGLLAPSPDGFRVGSNLRSLEDIKESASITSKGLQIFAAPFLFFVGVHNDPGGGRVATRPMPLTKDEGSTGRYMKPIAFDDDSNYGIYLIKIGPGQFTRDVSLPLANIGAAKDFTPCAKQAYERELFIRTQASDGDQNMVGGGLYLPFLDTDVLFKSHITEPPGLDLINKVVYCPMMCNVVCPLPVEIWVEGTRVEMVCFAYTDELSQWSCYLADAKGSPRLYAYLNENRTTGMNVAAISVIRSVAVMESKAGANGLKSRLDIWVNDSHYRAEVLVRELSVVPHISRTRKLYPAELSVKRITKRRR